MIKGLDAMHRNNIIHRDIKPANYVVDSLCNVKLIDFGLSKQQSVDALMTKQAITIFYRSPEVLLGSEVYSF